jgi:hypothetical protein
VAFVFGFWVKLGHHGCQTRGCDAGCLVGKQDEQRVEGLALFIR